MATAAQTHPMSDAEWQARQQLAACYRIFAHMGWDELIYNHISLRVPGEEQAFLINPFGLHYSEVKASNLVKIDIDGNTLDGSPHPVNRAGFVQHSVFHRHVPDAHCIIHTHTTAGMAVSSTQEGLLATNFYAGFLVGNIAYHDFEGVTVRTEEGARLVANLGDKRFMILRNHGLLVMGQTLPEAFLRYFVFERACEIQLATRQAGTPLIIPDEVLAVHKRDMFSAIPAERFGMLDFAAMVRVIDRIDPSWRD
ncbi:ribulose-5-phosphate 4-epimerase/fuculose-1-phosphate aldolase [Sphingobium sp. B1D7B]|uniref:class II aldolase/adducin family protein n=1 Tax=unclassified Sphingobium TaxID=2611147 RepID=UPI002224BDE9|nr:MULTISPECIES: class II aldolase/adducin family protein [unclassified Sphingobium]MCW2382360.1 ribulose-5-phosphate 4-epimerase/fuculose-1-phosphate aldolase [Sphingobium sp. B2D3B]MCW2391379.1 ribulose-5-phosphate 4-epimerase/fuculose-1-phosphate aldolase [Sphingobium sp. B11D3A]MCW2397467.1 ribulose-5-phosphate 4-epimerase/fuculose-1-phosphate aldolase [Sphingobium sp. B2D3C]MCW2406590.1 ribulose-5-phosphate 4-epimerase/fuculose-1-phosphate aldolase [Sphingobium sp. B1D7B]